MDDKFKAQIELVVAKQKSDANLKAAIQEFQQKAKIECNIDVSKSDAKKAMANFQKQVDSLPQLKLNRNNLFSRIEAWTKNNNKALPMFGSEIDDIKSKIQNADAIELKNLNKQFSTLTNKAQAAGKAGKTFVTQIKENIIQFARFTISATALMSVLNGFRAIINNVKMLDSAMTDLRKVTDETDVTYNAFLNRAADNAVRLGAAMSDIVKSTADFARLGYSLPDAEQLANVATVYKNVGDIDIGNATESIISTMKAFNVSAENSLQIVDKFNEVGNKFSISSAGIGNALKRSAATLMEAGNTLDQAIALQVAANNVVQDPETVGTAWRTVALRIRGAKTELEDAGLETEAMAESTSKLRDTIKAITNIDGSGGFDILTKSGDFKSTYDIILGIGQIWKDIKKSDPMGSASLLELLAGKRQSNVLAAAFNNLDDLQKSLTASMESSGSAMKENEKYLDSIAGKTDILTAKFQKLSNNTLDSKVVKGFIDLVGAIVTVTDKVGLFNIAWIALIGILGSKSYLVINALAAPLGNLAVKMGASATAATALGSALSVMIPVAVIMAGVWALNQISVSLEEQQQKVEKLNTEYQQIKTEIDELSKKQMTSPLDNPLTDYEKARLEYLKEYKTALEELRANEQSKLTMKEWFGDGDLWSEFKSTQSKELTNLLAKAQNSSIYVDTIFKSPDALQAGDLSEIVSSSYADYNKTFVELLKKQSDLQEAIDTFTGSEKDKSRLQEQLVQIAPAIDTVRESMERLLATGQVDNPLEKALSNFDNIVSNSSQLKSSIKVLSDLSKDDLLSVSISGTDEQKTAFEKLSESADKCQVSYSDLINYILKGNDALSDNNIKTEQVLKTTEQLTQVLSDVDDQMSSLSKAYQEQTENGSIADDTLISLMKSHENWKDLIISENGVIKLNKEAVIEYAKAKIQAQIDELEATKEGTQKRIALYQNEITVLQNLASASGNAAIAMSIAAQMDELGGKIAAANEEIEGTNLVIAALNNKIKQMGNNSDPFGNLANSAEKAAQKMKQAYSSANSAINSLLSTTISMLTKRYDEADDADKKYYQNRIDRIKSILEEEKESAEEVYNLKQKEIQARLDALKAQKSEHDYQKSLSEKQTNQAKIEADLITSRLDTSEAGKKRTRDLEDQLKSITDDISEYQYDRSIAVQEDILNKELERIKDEYDAEIKSIESIYKTRIDRLEKQLQAVSDNAKSEADIRNEAFELINKGGQQLYNDLIEYNRKYGDGVDQTIVNAWGNAYTSLKTFGDGQINVLDTLNLLALKMNDLDIATQKAAKAAGKLADELERGNNIKPTTKIYNGSAGDFKMMEYAGYSTGGVNDYTGLAMLHGTSSKSEVIFNASDASKLFNLVTNTSDLTSLIAGGILKNLGNFTSGLSAITNNSNINNAPSITVNVTGDATQNTVEQLKGIANNWLDQAEKRVFSKMKAGSLLGY